MINMTTIDCSMVPTQVTDFVFDQIEDEVDPDCIESKDYTLQEIQISESVDDPELSYILSKIHSLAHEKVCDMEYELAHNPDDLFDYTESEVKDLNQKIKTGCFFNAN